MIVGENLYKSWGNLKVLNDANISIKPGQITTLIGPSGSGKTTLIRTLALLDLPDSGSISIDGKAYKFPLMNNQEIEPPWPHITVVFQQLFLWPHLTLRENITLPLRNRQIKGSEERLNELIEVFEMRRFIDRYPNETSLGQRQRAALVRALILNPAYILMDEVTSAIDVEQINVLLKQLRYLHEKGIRTLLITHLIGFVRHTADPVVVLYNEKVLEKGGIEVLNSQKNKML